MGSMIPVEPAAFASVGSLPMSQMSHTRAANMEREPAIDPVICWQAIRSRDPRFDGRFFVGAVSTRIYCRNTCPIPFARPSNIVLFACAGAAELAGYRPCKRCQAQAAPGTPAWLGTSAVVNRAFRLILEGALNEGGVEELAGRLGLGSRQLRRLFVQHLGAPPLKIATTHRVHLARKLIDESKLAMTQIAFCSGFKSIREFNHAVRLSTGQSPGELRRAASAAESPTRSSGLELRLPYRRPFDWESLLAFLKRRAIPGVERVTQQCYQRTIETAGVPGLLTVRQDREGSRLVVELETSSYEGLALTVERIRRIFDLGADPVGIARHLSQDPRLRPLLNLRPGLRVPGVWDGFEAAVLAVLGQRLTTPGPRRTIARLVEMFGRPIGTPVHGLRYLFPRPEKLAHAGLADLAQVGIGEACADTLRKLARSTLRRHLGSATSQSLEQAVSPLMLTGGIDESTANYIAMRAFGEPDAFPSAESKLRFKLAGTAHTTSAEAIEIAEPWRPWRAYAAMHLAQ